MGVSHDYVALAFDPDGNVYVSEIISNHRTQKFTSTGDYLCQWGAPVGGFDNALWVATNIAGDVYVADGFNNRIQTFTSGVVPIKATSWGRLKVRYR